MNDSQYNLIAEDLLLAVEEAIEESGVDIDYEGVGGLLTLTFKNSTKIIINKQAPLHEIWIATKFNGHHFTYSDSEEIWVDKRGGDEFWQFLSNAVSIQAETEVTLSSE
ncbi:iron donor protein CyaY [Colwellia sp. 4_MG-2023]|jgi:CyaY protein|uniref:iron donor protein CyaY n=1 Tax=unclassified Colwellia TaxID=196834 RepID=UPI001C08ECEF|nr:MULTISPECIES: iron donor protein CyaY [unclassified Colwellia]MBU2924969.1 iron donor protein CyaY [Colwellia sp. C2M11]MDO6487741.1 iron donor protein CyaY [Colwellia sp. 6_MG-2023]MDO6506868.1 iron donor protein CyaY [Colwellia sp. 5_MG-2023]MDO6555757.1 iron donor protein CyaY [Colwellia sp. 4_MG-2023]MDO6652798.1 iron donor protein CyaY [Colwellia sp. 3_MG-2023]